MQARIAAVFWQSEGGLSRSYFAPRVIGSLHYALSDRTRSSDAV